MLPDTTQRISFNIPAQPLTRALDAFSRQAGLRVEQGLIESGEVVSHTTVGRFTPPEALRQLLTGTGNEARFDDALTVVVTPATADNARVSNLAGVVVTARADRRSGYAAGRTTSATRTDVALQDVPQAVTVLSHDLMADQSMQGMADVVRYIPGVTMGQGEGHRDAPTIRGNSSTADFFVNGIRDDVQYLRDLYNVERVEALVGPNAMVFGRGGGGGVINRVTKEARWDDTRELSLEGGSYDHRRAALDVGSAIGSTVAARLNGMLEDSRTFRDQLRIERQGINPTAALVAHGALIRVGYEYFADRRTVDRGIPSFQGRPSDIDIETFFGDPDVNRARAIVHAAGASIERSFAGRWQFRNRARFVTYDKFYRNIVPGAVDLTGANVDLRAYSNATDRSNFFNQADIESKFGAGALQHTVVAGAEIGHQSTANFRQTGFFNDTETSMSVAMRHPDVTVPVAFRQRESDADNESTVNVAAVHVQDQVSIGSRWQAIAGVRYERFALDFHDNRSDERLDRTDNMVSPRVGLVFKPVAPLSLYASYSVSYLPAAGDQFSSLTVTRQALEPERFRNRELGLKWTVNRDLAVTTALYRLDRSNTTAPDPVDPTKVVQTGRQRTTGVEAGVTGHVTSRWQVAGGAAVQRAKIVNRTTAAPAGARVPLVPRFMFSLWNRYQVASRLGAGLGIIHQADSYAAIDNTVTLPAFTRVDAAVFATLTDALRAQLNVENVLDRRYYGTSHGNNNILPGAPRLVRLSLSVTP